MSKAEQFTKKMEIFTKKYSDLMLDGLSSTGSYIKLFQEKGMNLSLQPHAQRVDSTRVVMAVKLRVANNKMLDKGYKSSDRKKAALLKWTTVPVPMWRLVDGKRASASFGQGYEARAHQGAEFFKTFDPKELAKQFYKQLEELTGKKFENRLRVINAMTLYFEASAPLLFHEVEKTTKPKAIADSIGNVHSFSDAKKSKEEAAAEDTSEA
jgi:hypothetical protein